MVAELIVKEIRPKTGGITIPRQDVIRGIIDSVSDLLFIEDLGDLLSHIATVAKKFAAVEQIVIWILDENGNWIPRVVLGFPEELRSKLLSISISPQEDDHTREVATWLTRLSLFVPEEITKETGYDREDAVLFADKEVAQKPRTSPDSWLEQDYLEVRLISMGGKLLGSIELRAPLDGKIPSIETIRSIEILASICSIAIELAELREKENAISDAAERRASQITQVFSFARNVLSLESPDKVRSGVLNVLRDFFGFQAATISHFDERENCFRYVAMMGYGQDEMEYAKTLRISLDAYKPFTLPEYMIGKNAYYLPAEDLPDESLVWEIYTPDRFAEMKKKKNIPRASPGAWHPLDDLSFVIYNKKGKVVGILSPDNPKDGRIPPPEVIDGIGIFTSLVSIALENAKYYSETVKAKEDIELLNGLIFHDVSSLNTTIREHLDMATAQGLKREQQIRHIRSAQRILDSMIDLVQKVRRLSSIRSEDAAELLRVDLAAAVRSQVSRVIDKYTDKTVKTSFGVMPANCFVLANDLIGDLFGNIISNAIVHNYNDEVEVSVSIEGLVDEFSNKTYWKVSIADNGSGITEGQKESIFDITSRLDESVGRTGIGLSVVNAITKLYGGSVWVEDRHPSDYSKGSVFQVLLPAA
ncbi:MAG TPA: HAMP domain-containing sensor histidine kinase [Thermoplasmata archaeon]|nr:HAMP domain-containing sensor histidine kinase [Thermoplasmata archaeon]